MHLLLQFYADSFETLQMFRSWSEGAKLFGYIITLSKILSLFSENKLSHFPDIITFNVTR